MKIGALPLPKGAILAPMAGVTDLPFRLLCREMGSALAVTEMVSAKGFLCAPENTRALEALLAYAPQEGPLALQLFGHEPDVVAEAATRLSGRGFAAIDINMGCPAPKITKNGEGSALLRDLPRAGRLIAAVRRATSLPLTVKMRAGWDAEHIVCTALARIAEAEGADAVTVHGRTRDQFYAGVANWEHVARVKAAISIPVIGNGDIDSAEDALQKMTQTGCDGVMIGRGAMGNPWIFAQIRAALLGEHIAAPTLRERLETALRHARMLMAVKGEAAAMREMRKHAAWYMKGIKDAARWRVSVQRITALRELTEVAFEMLDGKEVNTNEEAYGGVAVHRADDPARALRRRNEFGG